MLFNEKRIIPFIFLAYFLKISIIRPSIIEGMILLSLFLILSLKEFIINKKQLEIEEKRNLTIQTDFEKLQVRLVEHENKINNLQARLSVNSIKKSL